MQEDWQVDYDWRSWNVSSLQGRLLSSEHTVDDEVEKEVLICKGHTVRFLSHPITLSPISAPFPPSRSHMTGDGSSPRRSIVLHASGEQQPAHGSVR
jgi:hypothetical protein